MGTTGGIKRAPCGRCGIPHLPERDCVEVQREVMARLMKNISDPGECRACRAPICWVKMPGKAPHPYSMTGLSHFADCPNAEQFRKKPA
jgi:hypothetical protein